MATIVGVVRESVPGVATLVLSQQVHTEPTLELLRQRGASVGGLVRQLFPGRHLEA